jgi:drug/metabolite transporter (DMT)-like permease
VYGHKIDFKNSKDFKIIVIRTLIMNTQQFVMSYSLKYLQTPIVHTISNCGPIIVFILNYFIHKITVSGRQFIGIIIASVSLLIAINSIVIYHWLGYESYEKSSHYQYE